MNNKQCIMNIRKWKLENKRLIIRLHKCIIDIGWFRMENFKEFNWKWVIESGWWKI